MLNLEKHLSDEGGYFFGKTEKNLNFTLHCQDNYEFIYCYEGVVNVTVTDRIYRLREGKGMIIPPMQVHSYFTSDYCDVYLLVFSKDYVSDFYEKHKDYAATYPVFSLPSGDIVCKKLQSSVDVFERKSLFYQIASLYGKHTAFIPVDPVKNEIIVKTVDYIMKNYKEDISLTALSGHLGLSYNYVSDKFNETFGTGFSEAVNAYRVNEACRLLYTTDMTMGEIARETGYDSIRSFNRNFFKINGKSPSEARKIIKEGVFIDV